MKRRGFTLIEVVIVLTIIGIMASVAIRAIGSSSVKGSVRSAMDALATMHAVAKQSAIQRGRQTKLVLSSTNMNVQILARNTAGTGWDTVQTTEFDDRFNVSLRSTRDTLTFNPRGIGGELSATTVILYRSTFSDTLTISAAGRLVR